ncbi:MAG TPA: sulfotransferase [Acidimicrobiales bacterium]|nr:sulfotransferase [Acidimicrobiales bacterium]
MTFLELNHDPSRTLLLVGSGRSGTTWLAEILVDALGARLVFEPLRTQSVPWTWPVRRGHYLRPDDDSDQAVAEVLDRVLSGRIRNRFTDKYNRVRFPSRRVVKEVRATNLLPWIIRRYPRTPVVYLLRHPVPTAWSVSELGWPDQLEPLLSQESLMQGPLKPFQSLIGEAAASPDTFHRIVLQWCLENFVPVHELDARRVHVVFYEQMVDDPGGELERLRAYLLPFGTDHWHPQTDSATSVARPSRSNYRGTDVTSGSARLDAWVNEVPPDRVERALALVRGFGLDRIYDISTRAVIPADEVLLGGRHGEALEPSR